MRCQFSDLCPERCNEHGELQCDPELIALVVQLALTPEEAIRLLRDPVVEANPETLRPGLAAVRLAQQCISSSRMSSRLRQLLGPALNEAAHHFDNLSLFELANAWQEIRERGTGPTIAAFVWSVARRRTAAVAKLADRVVFESKHLGLKALAQAT